MNATIATTAINNAKAEDVEVTVTLTDGTEVVGMPISVNSKGVNVKVDGKVRSIGLNRVASIATEGEDEGELFEDGDEMTDEDIYAEMSDDMTTADLAALLSDHLNISLDPKELRVHLRALGLGVGKGRKYSLTASEYRMVRDAIKAEDAKANA